MRIVESLLDAPAEEGASVVALGLLSEVADAADRLEKGRDDEALHDLRVALRRVRSALRAFRPWLEESIKRRQEKKLKRIARSTNATRDAEVQLAWLTTQRNVLPSKRRRFGLDLLVDRLEARLRDGRDPADVSEQYRLVAKKLRRRLRKHVRRTEAAGVIEMSFGGLLARLLEDQLDSLRDRIDRIRGPSDEAAVHEARIEAKRLRYLLEPLRGCRDADASDPVRQLNRLQDVLGDLHDAHLLAAEVRSALVDVAADRARPGLLAVARLVRERRDALHADLERRWRVRGLGAIEAEVRDIVAALDARATRNVTRSEGMSHGAMR